MGSLPSNRKTVEFVLRLTAVCYLFAFASLAVQVSGLCGPDGMWPASEWLAYLGGRIPAPARFWTFPTLFWLGASDGWLVGGAAAGCVFALAAAAGFLPIISFALCFVLYLSFYTAAGPFLHFQWDLLLLESGFLALFAAPLLDYRKASEPARALVFLYRFLVFKLMLMSGLCKLASGDQTWRTLTALNFHYETQPLPPWTAWYFHHLPGAFQKLSVLVMFAVELVSPALIFAGRRPRLIAFWGIVSLQLLIAFTGNYGFFNWLTIALAFSLLDDRRLGFSAMETSSAAPKSRHALAAVLCAVLVPSSIYLAGARWIDGMPRAAFLDRWVAAPLETWPIIGSYGLFSVMTTERREIVLEGSDDGENWKEYGFRWKPGDVDRRPAFTGPHMPRLDWQMWFAALGTWHQNQWLLKLCGRILEGSPHATRLLKTDPFAGKPPRFMRAVVYDYHFTEGRSANSKAWWKRDNKKMYLPPVSLNRPS